MAPQHALDKAEARTHNPQPIFATSARAAVGERKTLLEIELYYDEWQWGIQYVERIYRRSPQHMEERSCVTQTAADCRFWKMPEGAGAEAEERREREESSEVMRNFSPGSCQLFWPSLFLCLLAASRFSLSIYLFSPNSFAGEKLRLANYTKIADFDLNGSSVFGSSTSCSYLMSAAAWVCFETVARSHYFTGQEEGRRFVRRAFVCMPPITVKRDRVTRVIFLLLVSRHRRRRMALPTLILSTTSQSPPRRFNIT